MSCYTTATETVFWETLDAKDINRLKTDTVYDFVEDCGLPDLSIIFKRQLDHLLLSLTYHY